MWFFFFLKRQLKDCFKNQIKITHLEGNASLDGLDGEEVNADDETRDRHVLLRHLHPGARSGTQVNHHSALFQKFELAIKL